MLLTGRGSPTGLTWSAWLGAAETALGAAFAIGVANAIAGYRNVPSTIGAAEGFSPLRPPLLLPTVVLLLLGPWTLWVTVFRRRRAH